MKPFVLFLSLCLCQISFGQSSFTINQISDPEISYFTDIEFFEGKYYALSNHLEHKEPYRDFSKISVFDNAGNLLSQTQIGAFDEQYFQFYSIDADRILMAGGIETDSCKVKVVISEFIPSSQQLTILSEYPICPEERTARRMYFKNGLNGDVFLEGSYGSRISSDIGDRNFFMKVQPDLQLTPIEINQHYGDYFTIDFSRKGYLIKDTHLMNFYDTEFNERKQRYNFLDDYENEPNTFSIPFGSHYILDQTYKNRGEEQGEALRLLDSNFYIRDLAVIHPDPGSHMTTSFPRYGGLLPTDDQHVWTTANFGYTTLNSDPCGFSISKLNEDLDIVCQHFFGFTRIYRIYGISKAENDGVIVYGFHQPGGVQQWKGQEEPFAFKIGDNCDLTTSIEDHLDAWLISAYPNPSANSLSFNVQGLDPSVLHVSIFDLQGREVFRDNQLQREINVSNLPTGQYFYQVRENEKILGSGSWVKQ